MSDVKKTGEVHAALQACARHFSYSALFSAAINLLYLTPSIYLLQVYDRVLNGNSITTLVMLTAIAVVALASMAALDQLRAQMLIRAGLRLDRQLSLAVLRAMNARGLGRGMDSAGLRELDTFRQAICGSGIQALFDAPWAIVYIAVCFLLHPLIGWLTLLCVAILFALAVLNELRTRPLMAQANDLTFKGYKFVDANIRNAEVIHALGMLPDIARRWSVTRSQAIAAQGIASIRGASVGALIKFSRLAMQAAIIGLGAYLVIERQMHPGGIFAASLLLGRALQPVETAVGNWKQWIDARRAFRYLTQLLADHPAPTERTALPAPQGALLVEQVSYSPARETKPILRNVSFSVQAGEHIGIIGPSSAGKSTLLKLLVGVLRPSAGVIRIDGADNAGFDRELFGKHIGYLPQDIELLTGTVAENIARFTVAEGHQIVEAAKLVDAHEMILRLPNGYETEVGPGGMLLSGGQRQRIGLARAVFGDPVFIILDEPNSNLDSDGEFALAHALQRLKAARRTVLMASHRVSALKAMDRIILIRDGVIEQIDTTGAILGRLNGPAANRSS